MQKLADLIADKKENPDFIIAYDALNDYKESQEDTIQTVNRAIYETPLIYYSDMRAYIHDHVELVEEWINENAPEAPINLWNVIAETEIQERMERVMPHISDAVYVIVLEDVSKEFPVLLDEDENSAMSAIIEDQIENDMMTCRCLADIIKHCRDIVDDCYSEEE
jgi:hypothetical protein